MSADRLFISIPLPGAVREQLAALYEPMRSIAWTRPEQLHLTLRFLGDVERTWAGKLEETLGTVHVEPFILPLSGLGAFPPRGPARVIWLGVGTGHPRLHQLRQQIDDALLAAEFPLEVRIFHPHVTLGRVKESGAPAAAGEFLKRRRAFEAAPVRVEVFQLYASELQPTGAVHTLKRTFQLQPAR